MDENRGGDDRLKAYLALSQGTQVGRYCIIRLLGSGGMGDVYLAQDTELNRQVALKFLSFVLASDPNCRIRFTREAHATAKLNHPNIVTIHEVGEFNSRPFMAMEYVEGESLKSLIEKQKLPVERALDIALQLCRGLAEAHAAGIVHRDIKPNNILINNKGLCKLLDFGLAAMQGCESLTKTGSTLGTVNYMSPEQVLGKDVDTRSDIFSFGVLLYEMLTGRLPFHGDIEAVMMYAIANEKPDTLSRHKPGIPQVLQGIIDKALQKRPEDRYQAISDLADELSTVNRDRSREHNLIVAPTVPRVSFKPRIPTSFPRRKITAAAVAILTIAAVIALFLVNPFKSSDGTLKRVVVVPFKNQTGDPTLDPLGRMVADWATQSLAQTGWVEAVPPEALSGLEKTQDIKEIAGVTGASMIVLGSYYQFGDSIRFQAKVVNANDKLLQAVEPISSQSTKSMEGVEVVLQKVVGALAMQVNPSLLDNFRHFILKPPSYEAYQQAIQGLDLFMRESDWVGSIKYFEKAFSIDTSYMYPLFFMHAALRTIGQFAQADSVLQFLALRRDRLTHFQQLQLENFIAVMAGDGMKALVAAREEAKAAPGHLSYVVWGQQALMANYPRECIQAFLKVNPKEIAIWPYTLANLADAYHLIGDYKKELETARQGRRMFPGNSLFLLREIQAFAALGKIGDLRRVLGETADYEKGQELGFNMRFAARELRAHGHEDTAMAIYYEAIRWFENLQDGETEPQRIDYGVTPEKIKSRRFDYGIMLYEARRYQPAKTVFEELMKDSTENPSYIVYLGLAAARLGEKERALEISAGLGNIKQPYLFGRPNYYRARIAAILGDKTQAVNLLKESARQGNGDWMLAHVEFDLESLRDYPLFKEFIRPKG